MHDQPQIPDMRISGGDQAMPDTGVVYFNADLILIRVPGGLLHQGFAVTKANLEHHRRCTAKECGEVEWFCLEIDAEFGPQFIEGSLLRWRQSTGAAHEAANCPVLFRCVTVCRHRLS
jgi:hypothetical protein